MCDDVDNCPEDPNTDQADLDADGSGDVCDDVDGLLTIRRLRIRQSNSPTGRILARGIVVPETATDSLDFASGLAIRIRDALALDVTASWAPPDCKSFRSGIQRCRSQDHVWHIRFQPYAGGAVRFTLDLRRLNIVGPFEPPLVLRLTQGVGIDRLGSIEDCRRTANGLICR